MEKICVHTPTQEQWDIVLANSKNLWGQLSSDWDCYKEDSHLFINNGCTKNSTNYVRHNKYKILTFDEWVEKYKIELEWVPKVGDWVVVTKGIDLWDEEMNKYIGQCLQVRGGGEHLGYNYIHLEGNTWFWYQGYEHFRKPYTYEIPTNKPVSLQGGESMVYESSITLNMGSDLIISKNKKNLVIPIKVEIKENQIRVPLIEKQPRSVFEIKTKY